MTTSPVYEPPSVKLSNDQQGKIANALRALQDLKPLQDKASECGIDCSGYENLRRELMGRLEAVQRHFGQRDPSILS